MTINNKIIQSIIDREVWDNYDFFIKEINKIDKLAWCKYPMIDAHLHLVDFTQKTTWIKHLLSEMNKSNIIWAVVFWLPVIKIWLENEKEKPEYYLDDDNKCYYYSNTDVIVANEYLSLNKEDRKKIFPLICWFNPLDINSVEHIEMIYKTFPWVFCWVWEVFYRHDDLTHLTYWEVPTMNTKATKKLFEFITKYDLPLSIHQNITAPWISDYPKFLHELENMLREFPKARVILSHCWASRRLRAPYYTKMIERLLREYPWLYVDYSWVIFDEIIAINDVSINEWVQLTEDFPDRVMIWSDVLWNAFWEIWYLNSKFNSFLDKLSDITREKVCIKNAINVYSKSKNRVEKWNIRIYPKLNDII